MINSDNLVEATILALQGKLPLTETKKLARSKKLKKENVDVIVNKEDNSTYVETPDTIVTVANKDTIEDTSTDISTQTPDVLEVPVDSDETIVPEEDLPDDTVQDIVDSDETIVPEEDLKECNKGQLKIESTETDEDEEEDEEDEEEDEEKEETLEEIINRAYEEELSAINTYDLVLNKIENEESNEKLIEMINEIKKDEEDHKSLLNHYIETGEALTDDELEELKNSKETNEDEDDEDAYGDFKQGNQDDEDLQEAKKLRRSIRGSKGKFNSKTFNEVFTKYFTQKYHNIKESKVTKLGVSENGLKIEGVLVNKYNKQKTICLEMRKISSGNKFTKYQVVESKGLLQKSKDKSKTLNLMVYNKNNVLECKYLIQK